MVSSPHDRRRQKTIRRARGSEVCRWQPACAGQPPLGMPGDAAQMQPPARLRGSPILPVPALPRLSSAPGAGQSGTGNGQDRIIREHTSLPPAIVRQAAGRPETRARGARHPSTAQPGRRSARAKRSALGRQTLRRGKPAKEERRQRTTAVTACQTPARANIGATPGANERGSARRSRAPGDGVSSPNLHAAAASPRVTGDSLGG